MSLSRTSSVVGLTSPSLPLDFDADWTFPLTGSGISRMAAKKNWTLQLPLHIDPRSSTPCRNSGNGAVFAAIDGRKEAEHPSPRVGFL